jgi:iron complex outermembrane receptor protein
LGNKLTLENGIGIGNKWIKTSLTPSVNTAEKAIRPFSKTSVYYNLFSGLSFLPNQQFNFKVNLATGVRIPNLAELSSNGLHEGVFTYEIGNPDLKNEQNISLNLLANMTSKYLDCYISPFYNQFFNYVYLAPTNEQWFGFPVYRYRQQNAKQYGTEMSIITKPFSTVQLGISYSGMISKTKDGNFTPFIPAQKISPIANYTFKIGPLSNIKIASNIDYCLAQNNIYPNEIATPSYLLWNMSISSSFKSNNTLFSFSVAANNILNTAYFDHLSRFKNFGLLNIGRNIVLMLKVNLHSQIKQ